MAKAWGWTGIWKVVEETGELNHQLGKALGGKPNAKLIEEELADTLAAIEFFIENSPVNKKRIERRRKGKLKRAVSR